MTRFAFAHYDHEPAEAAEARAEARRIRAGNRSCPECSGTMSNHVGGCPEERPDPDDEEE